jgi:hypothetical protein
VAYSLGSVTAKHGPLPAGLAPAENAPPSCLAITSTIFPQTAGAFCRIEIIGQTFAFVADDQFAIALPLVNGLTGGAFNSVTNGADDDARIEMATSTAIEDPPAPCRSGGTGIPPYLYTEFCVGLPLGCPSATDDERQFRKRRRNQGPKESRDMRSNVKTTR